MSTVRARPPVNALVSVPEAPVAAPASVASLAPLAEVGRGKHARRAAQDETPSAAGLDGQEAPDDAERGADVNGAANGADVMGTEAMLALLAAESRKPLSGLAGRLDSNATRVGVMAGGIVGFSLLLFLVMVVIGSLI